MKSPFAPPPTLARILRRARERAFSRAELLALLAALGLLALVVIPALANGQATGARVACLNNLRQVSLGFRQWADDHSDSVEGYYWWSRKRTETNWTTTLVTYDSGIPLPTISGTLWFQYYVLSNELATPRILACPSDATARVADDFSHGGFGGFRHSNYQNQAISYPLYLHALAEQPHAVLASDYNVRADWEFSGCYTGAGAFSILYRLWFPNTGWTNGAVHDNIGNVAFTDGRAETLTDTGLRAALSRRMTNENGLEHLLFR